MSNLTKTESSNLELLAKRDEFNAKLSTPPHADVIKEENGVKYIPIGFIENMLTQLFTLWRVELLDYKVVFNSLAVSIRLHYYHPNENQWLYQDGIGAVDVQVEKGCSPADLSKIKHGAIQKGLPAAMNYAVKNAAKRLGVLFGRDLNRKIDKKPKNFKGFYSAKLNELMNGNAVITDETA